MRDDIYRLLIAPHGCGRFGVWVMCDRWATFKPGPGQGVCVEALTPDDGFVQVEEVADFDGLPEPLVIVTKQDLERWCDAIADALIGDEAGIEEVSDDEIEPDSGEE